MKAFQDLTSSIGRSASDKQAKRASILSEKPLSAEEQTAPAEGSASKQTDSIMPKTEPASAAEDMIALWDTLARAPSQDISRPFDNPLSVPPTIRASETGSLAKRKNRRSLASTAPPTLGSANLETSSFADAFKPFTELPPSSSPNAITASPSITAVPSLTSDTTIDTNLELAPNGLLSPATPTPAEPTIRSASPNFPQSPTSPKEGGVFKGLSRFRSRVSSYLQHGPDKSSKSVTSPPATPTTESNTAGKTAPPKIVVANSMTEYKEKNSSNSSLGLSGSIRRLARRSKDSRDSISADGEKEREMKKSVDETSSEAPSSPGGKNGDDKSARKFAHGVLLHPIVEEDK